MSAPLRGSQTVIAQCVHDAGHPLGSNRAADHIPRCRASAGIRAWSPFGGILEAPPMSSTARRE